MSKKIIYLDDAIDTVKKYYRAHDNDLLELIAFNIERLPPAQPEVLAHGEGELSAQPDIIMDTMQRTSAR